MKTLPYNGKQNISGERIREARLRARISQTELAAQLQTDGILIEQDVLSKIEHGTRLVQDFELKAIARRLKVSVDWLVGNY